jgi:hypothetical protein
MRPGDVVCKDGSVLENGKSVCGNSPSTIQPHKTKLNCSTDNHIMTFCVEDNYFVVFVVVVVVSLSLCVGTYIYLLLVCTLCATTI